MNQGGSDGARSSNAAGDLQFISEGQTAELLSHLSDAVFFLDPAWRVSYSNSAAQNLVENLGSKPESVLGSHFVREVLPFQSFDRVESLLQSAISKNESALFEHFVQASGRSLLIRAVPQASGMLVLVRDDTEERQTRRTAEMYRLLSARSRDAMLFFDLTGRIVEANEAAISLYGYDRKDLLRKTLYDIREESTHEDLARQLKEVQGGALRFGTIQRDENGRTFPVEVSWSFTQVDGEPLVLSIVRDISDRRAHEEALAESAERLRVALQGAKAGIWERDLETLETKWIEGMPELLGVNSDQLSKTESRWLDFVHVDDRENVLNSLQAACRSEGEWFADYRVLLSSGELRWISSRGQVLAIRNRKKMLGVDYDITERKAVEDRCSQVLGNLPVGVYTCDAQGRITFFNSKAAELWGREPAKGVDAELFCGSYRLYRADGTRIDPAQTPMADALRTGKSFRAQEVTLERPDGSRIEVSVNIDPILENGAIVGAINCFSDETARIHAQQSLRLSEERLRLALEAGRIGMWTTDLVTGVTESTTLNKSLFGIAAEASMAQGEEWMRLIHPDDRKKVLSAWESGLESASGYAVAYRVVWPDGSVHWLDSRGWFHSGPDGKAYRILGVTLDITEQKHSEQELRARQAALSKAQWELEQHAANLEHTVSERTMRLRETVSELEAFAYTISHDLRSPLRSVEGFANVLIDDYRERLDGDPFDLVKRIQRTAVGMNSLVEDILAYSKLSKVDVQLRAIHLDELVKEITAHHPELEEKGLTLQFSNPCAPVLGNVAYLTQCISNLLRNAAKFVAPGVKPHVHIRCDNHGTMIRVWFIDNGIGIDEADHDKLFHVFARIDSGQQFEGTGVGLAIVKKAVERMGGRVGVQSELGKGSRFWIELKRAD